LGGLDASKRLSGNARIAVSVFGAAIIGWTLTRLGDTMIALAAALVLVAAGVVTQEELHAALGNELIWLLVAAFVIAAALRASGVAERAALALVSRFAGVRSMFIALTAVLAATALIIPSTSWQGRANDAACVFAEDAPGKKRFHLRGRYQVIVNQTPKGVIVQLRPVR
jgi:di/tricarboxylate transporter